MFRWGHGRPLCSFAVRNAASPWIGALRRGASTVLNAHEGLPEKL
jgi:hypothetical protein